MMVMKMVARVTSSILTQLIVGQVGDIDSYFGVFHEWVTVEKVHEATRDQGWLFFIFSLGLYFLSFKRTVA